MSKLTEAHIQFLEKQLKDLDNGTIELTIHNGVVSRLSKTERNLFADENSNETKQVIHLTQKV